MDSFDALLRALADELPETLRQTAQEIGDDLLSDSRDEVPYQEGDLSRSGQVTVETTAEGVAVAVSYDTPYAVIQHEATDFAHQDGRKADYLGGPLRENSRTYLEYIQRAILG